MRTFGLIGFPLSHSFSQKYFTEKFARENITDCEFKNFLLDNIRDFPALLKSNPSLCGLSVTIPHKQRVMDFLDEVDDGVRKVGSVNCIKITSNLLGYNTDVFGFENSLVPVLKSHHSDALILGAGGAAKAVEYVLKKLKIEYLFVTRNRKAKAGSISYDSLTKTILSQHPLIINTTPLGMFPKAGECPDIPYQHLTDKHLLFDLVYNPAETLFLKRGREMGTQTKNGLEMLELQAEKSWEIWNS